MSIGLGSIVIVASGPPGAQIHHAARVVEEAADDRLWLDVNITGSHLPQMYRLSEMTEVGPPSSVLHHGLCPSCLGWGLVDKVVPVPGTGPCNTCGGSGRMGVTSVITHPDSATTEGRMSWELVNTDGIPCEVCRAAFKPQRMGDPESEEK